ncbi:hypothetical protein LPAF129_01940 [Ligilactobacillus pabuli]|uniref:Uncharacterized protein n=1 Tax=Ligilactobacillus pabuli TaxID=2886039 RepID=A0ABQ5JEL9_9LACO|nr:hypothetical protein [Ligilactobacillus pabuli]GKS80509.1 hypothetical protein LPAF129_01940 [Ligilactobacillus pabuli]
MRATGNEFVILADQINEGWLSFPTFFEVSRSGMEDCLFAQILLKILKAFNGDSKIKKL